MFESTEELDFGEKLLGELLSYLRKSKEMSLLMLSRQIKKIFVENSVVEIYGEDPSLVELEQNEKFNKVLSSFFEERQLSFKVKTKQPDGKDLEELKMLLGSKLKII